MGPRSRAARAHRSLALVLRRTNYGEADLIVTLFTQAEGKLSAIARAARKSQRRFGGTLEPLHTLEVELEERADAEVLWLREARLSRVRPALLEDLAGLEAAGRFLGWLRHAAPERTCEPGLWRLSEACLDALDARAARSSTANAQLALAHYGLQLLVACGWRLELEHCVQSGAPCPDGKAAMIDPELGGLVSRAQGGAPISVSGAQRKRLILAQAGATDALLEEDAELALKLVEWSLKAHAGL